MTNTSKMPVARSTRDTSVTPILERELPAVLADAGAAMLLQESETNGTVLTDTVKALVADTARRTAMEKAAKAMAKANAADTIADIVIKSAK